MNEVITQTERGTLIQLDGTETDLNGNALTKTEVAVKADDAEKQAEAVNEEAKARVENERKAATKAAAKAKK